MSITLTKTKLALAVLAAAMLVPTTALATIVFDDGAFYAPIDNVTRGSNPPWRTTTGEAWA